MALAVPENEVDVVGLAEGGGGVLAGVHVNVDGATSLTGEEGILVEDGGDLGRLLCPLRPEAQ